MSDPLKAYEYHREDAGVIYCGDCLEILPLLQENSVDLVLTDPPWGNSTNCDSQRFIRAPSPWWQNQNNSKRALIRKHIPIHGDDCEFDPSPLLFTHAILWGANWYCRHLPHSGGWLIWDKRKSAENMAEKGWPLGEAELAWTNVCGATRVFRNLWAGLLRSTERGEFYHPTQKPVALMQWCIRFSKTSGIILDPYLGSGTTAVAAKQLGRRFLGIEIEEKYCAIAKERLSQEVLAL